VLKATLEELRLLAASPVPEQELERVRTVYLADLDYSRDSVSEMGIRFGWGTLMGVARSIDEDQQLVAQVSAKELQELAAELFRPENRFLGVIGPIESIDQQRIEQLLQR